MMSLFLLLFVMDLTLISMFDSFRRKEFEICNSTTFHGPPRFLLQPTGGSRPIVWETLGYTISIISIIIVCWVVNSE